MLDGIEKYLTDYFNLHANEKRIYHNSVHSRFVVNAAIQIADHYQLNERDFFIVVTAAWFHDSGYCVTNDGHEEQSAVLAEEYLKTRHADAGIIEEIKGCILATKMPQNPKGLLQEILCDADLFHLGTKEFWENSKLIRKEIELTTGKDISKQDWREKTIHLMEGHHYHTDYARLLLNDEKSKNLQMLKEKQAEWRNRHPEPATEQEKINMVQNPGKSKNPPDKKDRPDKGIETMFRISSTNHQRLSDMADNKAQILITVNSIILSAIISLLLRRLEEHPSFVIPTFIILVISLISMIFAILSTRPSIPDGVFSKEDVTEKRVNLLFFGNFYRMSLEDYTYGMLKTMESRDFLYGSLIKDIYSQGIVLGKKYRLLRIAYNIFMFGLIVSVIAFSIASVFNDKH